MPCYDPDTSPSAVAARFRNDLTKLENALAERDAMLCAVMSSLEDFVMSDGHNAAFVVVSLIDEAKSGVTSKAIHQWWAAHKMADRQAGR